MSHCWVDIHFREIPKIQPHIAAMSRSKICDRLNIEREREYKV